MHKTLRTLLVTIAGVCALALVGCSSPDPAADTSKVVPKDKAPAGLQEGVGGDGAGGGKPAKAAPDQSTTAP